MEDAISAAVAVPGIAIAAFALWLTVRIVNRRKRLGARFWITLSVVLSAYPLSFGPACWISSHSRRGAGIVSIAYQPLFGIWWTGPPGIRDVVEWYGTVWANSAWELGLPPSHGNGLRWDDFSDSMHGYYPVPVDLATDYAAQNEQERDSSSTANGGNRLAPTPDTPRLPAVP